MSLPRWNTSRLDVAEFPRQQNAHKQKDRKTHTKGQGPGHIAGFSLAFRAVFQHEKKCRSQAGEDGKERDHNKVSHMTDYPAMSAPQHSRRFLIVLLAAVVMVAGTFSLGQWQLRRAAQKEALHSRIQAMNKLTVLHTPTLLQLPDPASAVDRAVLLTGHWVSAKTVYLDNRPMGDKTGFWVYTPLVLAGSDQTVLVQRGWVPRNFMDRSKLPRIETADGPVTVSGRIAPPPSKLYSFGGADQGQIRQNIDVESFRQETGLPLLNVSVVQLGLASEGLKRDWPAPNLGVDKHYGYALQWFALCGLTAGLYGWFQVLVPWRLRRFDSAILFGKTVKDVDTPVGKPRQE